MCVYSNFKRKPYVANGARISSDKRAYIKHDIPIERFPSNPKKLIIRKRLKGNRDAVN